MDASRTLPDHDRCDTHRGYKLSCEQYELLLTRSGQVCEICGKSVQDTSERKLAIDHSGPKWAVRGLLCRAHNTQLQAGHGWFPGSAEYLARTWWIQECTRLGIPTKLADQPPIGSAIRDQFQTIWIREADGHWHPYGPGSPGVSRWTWEIIFERRGPQNMAPFDVYGPNGTASARLQVERVQLATKVECARQAGFEEGRAAAAREVLAELTDGQRDEYLQWATEDEPQAEADHLVSGATCALNDINSDLHHLQHFVVRSLADMPGGAGSGAMKTAREMLYARCGPDFTMMNFVTAALKNLDDELRYQEAGEYLWSLPDEESTEWNRFACSLYDTSLLSDKGIVVRAARCARMVADGSMFTVMCVGKGQHIRACPQRATHYALFADLPCCAEGFTDDHVGHQVCERCLEQLMDGTFISSRDRTYTAIDFRPIKTDSGVPF